MKLAFDRSSINMCRPISGLVYIRDQRIIKGRKNPVFVPVICNPSTGQSFTLPRMKTRNKTGLIKSFLGYDPVEKQFKVLSMILSYGICVKHQVLTLGTRKASWRMIECCISHHPGYNAICINGVLYYRAKATCLQEHFL